MEHSQWHVPRQYTQNAVFLFHCINNYVNVPQHALCIRSLPVILASHVGLCLQTGLFPSCPHQNSVGVSPLPTHATCPAHLSGETSTCSSAPHFRSCFIQAGADLIQCRRSVRMVAIFTMFTFRNIKSDTRKARLAHFHKSRCIP